MKMLPLLLAGALGAAAMFSCSPAPHEKKAPDTVQKGVNAESARIWLAPIINNSDIASIEGWPNDTVEREVLMRHFDKIEAKLLAELRRCEKYGLYTVVNDSAAATMTVTVSFEGFTRDYDTVTIPVKVRVESTGSEGSSIYDFKPTALAQREVRQENPFHYVGMILKNYANGFPYGKIARLFYTAQ